MGGCTSSYELPDMSDLSEIAEESIKKLQGPLGELVKVVSEYNRKHKQGTEDYRSICQTLINNGNSILEAFQALQNKKGSNFPKRQPNYGNESYRRTNGNTQNDQNQSICKQHPNNLETRIEELKDNESQEATAQKQENENSTQQRSDGRTIKNKTVAQQPVETNEDSQLKGIVFECATLEQQKEGTHDNKTQHHQELNNEDILVTDPCNENFHQRQRTENGKTQHETKETSKDEKNVNKPTENTSNEIIHADMQTLERDKDKVIDGLNSELNKTKMELASLKIRYEDLVRLQNRREQLLETSRGRLGHVQILDKSTGRLQKDAIKELKAMLCRTLNTGTFQLNVINCCEPADVKSEIPLLVICFVVSRLGTDVLRAVDGIHDLGKAMLLIFHHTKQPVHPSKYTLKDSQLTKLNGRIQDFAFFDGEGIYLCSVNENSMDNVADFIRTYFN